MFELKKYREVMFHDTKKWYKIWLAVWKMTWGIGTLMWSCYPKQKIIELKINRGVMYHDNEEWWKIWKKTDLCFMRNLANFHRLEKGNFILESKMVELNQNKNSKQLDWTDAVRRLYFFLEINE